jgi:hypothetical protein
MAFDIITHPHICLEDLVMGMKTLKINNERISLSLNPKHKTKEPR